MPVFFCVLTKTRNDLRRPKTTWNDLQRARNDLKRPGTSKKWLETTYNEQETTWNDLQQARNDLKWPTTSKKQPKMTWDNLQQERNDMKWPTVSKKRPETIYRKQVTTWKDLQGTDSNFMEPLNLKNNQLEGSNVTKKRYIISVVAIFCIMCAYERKINANVRTKRSKAKKHWIITWLASSLV